MAINKFLFGIFFFLGIFCVNSYSFAARLHPEKVYQAQWCQANGGESEVRLADNSRVDCVLEDYAIEFDFANKWSEAIGQSLYYAYSLGKKAAIVLIMENYSADEKYLTRLNKIAGLYGIKVWTIGADYVENNMISQLR